MPNALGHALSALVAGAILSIAGGEPPFSKSAFVAALGAITIEIVCDGPNRQRKTYALLLATLPIAPLCVSLVPFLQMEVVPYAVALAAASLSHIALEVLFKRIERRVPGSGPHLILHCTASALLLTLLALGR